MPGICANCEPPSLQQPLNRPSLCTTLENTTKHHHPTNNRLLRRSVDYNTANASKQPTHMPNTTGSSQAKRFRKAQCPIVERLTNYHMIHGRNNSKKLMDVRIVKHATDIIHLLTDPISIQIIIDDVINRLVMGTIAG